MRPEMKDENESEKLNNLPPYLISREFGSWYSGLLGKKGEVRWDRHPHFALVGGAEIDKTDSLKVSPRKKVVDGGMNFNLGVLDQDYIVSSSNSFADTIAMFDNNSLIYYLEHMPPVTSADLLQSEEKISKLFTLDEEGKWFVAIEVDNPKKISENLRTLVELTRSFNSVNSKNLPIMVPENWAFVGEDNHHLLITPFLGITLEQFIKEGNVDASSKSKILETLRSFAVFCDSQDFFWRDLAPRNILLPKGLSGGLVLIDYENLYQASDLDKSKRHSLDINRRIWFGDIFENEEITQLFSEVELKNYSPSKKVQPADDLERIVLSKREISQKEKDELQEQTVFIERRHFYNNRAVYGHRIGRYLTDFTQADDEAKLYFALRSLNYDTFCRYMFLMQSCIDFDSKQMLAKKYGMSTKPPITGIYLKEIQQNLSDNKKVDFTLDKYEEGLK